MTHRNEQLQSLLVDRAVEGLDLEHQQKLEDLLGELPDRTETGFELAAAAIELAFTEEEEPLPQRLRQRLKDQRRGFEEGRQDEVELAPILPFPSQLPSQLPSHHSVREERKPANIPPLLGWTAALAATLLAALGWAPRIAEELAGPTAEVVNASLPDTGERRNELLQRRGEVVQVAWTATEDPAAASVAGDLVWSSELQEGYMLFEGLPVNDPGEWQYQLWIFDREQDERFPVDGGVFDVTEGTTIIPIRAKLRVKTPYLFAITIEQPGGVVVSSRERLPLLASI